MSVNWSEENVEFLELNGERIAMFTQKGELYMLKKANRTDRQGLFSEEQK